MNKLMELLAVTMLFSLVVCICTLTYMAWCKINTDTHQPPLIIKAQNTGVCGHCGETTIVTIRETAR